MSTLIEQIKAKIETASDDSVEKWFKDNGWVPTEGKVIPSKAAFIAGVEFVLPLLEKAIKQRNLEIVAMPGEHIPKSIELDKQLLELME